MKKQLSAADQNQNQNPIIPKVRYHPSIQTSPTPRPRETQSPRSATLNPPQTGTTVRPPQTGTTLNPPQTGTTVRSPQTGTTVRPPQTGTTVRPPQTGTTVRPPQTGTTLNPPQTGTTVRSPQTGTTVRPPQTGTTVRPPQTGTTVRSPQTGTTVRSPQTGTTVRSPQTGTTVRSPQTGSGPAQVNPPRLDGDADSGPDRASLSPEQVPLGLGLQVDRQVVEQVEVLTRGQSTNQDWFTWRKNRITASVAHRITHCRFVNGKSKAPPASYLAAITGEGRHVQTRAMSWGVQMEAEAVGRYQEMKSVALGRSVSVQDCGLFIDARRPWLAASPDGIVTDSQTGQWLLCLEVKCPYKHRQRTVEDACRQDPAFCLEITDHTPPASRLKTSPPAYRLKTSHSYYTQIQVQLAVTGLRDAELAVFTLKELAIVPVTFDPALWDATVSKLETFYRDAVLPHLRQDTQRDTAAAPEL